MSAPDVSAWSKQMNASLASIDPEIADIIEHEKNRQVKTLQLIASENYTSSAVMEALGSVLTNKYSEGLPGARYYAGNEFIDQSERLCQKRALEAFNVKPEEWGVNVQPLSGSPANFYVYTALLKPHDRILALDLPHGGHLSHGYQTPSKKVSAVSIYFETMAYRLNEATGIIDYDKMEELAVAFRPKIIIAGTSAYSRLIDYKRVREVCDKVGALMLADMAHISGLVAAQVIPTPFEYADIVTTTTHKSLRGPRGAMIFFRRGPKKDAKTGEALKDKQGNVINYDFEDKINATVFPGHQGGPHNHTIGALAVALKLTKTKEYVEYQHQVVKNSKAFATKLSGFGYNIVSGGTDNHMFVIDLKNKGLDGARVDKVLEVCSMIANKNTTPNDKNAIVPSGIRIGTPSLTTRGFLEADCETVADFVDRGIKIAVEIAKTLPANSKFADFKTAVDGNLDKFGLKELKHEVEQFSSKFPAVGFAKETMKYPIA